MLSITRFPRRFATANKRKLRSQLPRAASALVPAVKTRESSNDSPLLPSSLLLPLHKGLYGTAAAASGQRRGLHAPPSNAQSSSFATAAAATHSDEDAALHERQNAGHGDDSALYGERGDEWFTTTRNPRTDPSFPGVDAATGRLSAIKMPDLRSCSREEMLDYVDNSWALTDALFATLQGERAFMTPPPHHLRHPLIFYYGHPTSFFVNKFLVAGLISEPVNTHFEHVFEVGVDEMRWDDMSKNEMQWPCVADVLSYRHEVYQLVRHVVETHPGLEPGHEQITEQSPLWALQMAIEHERIHHETSSMLMLEHPVEFFQGSALLPAYHESMVQDTPLRPEEGVDYPKNELLDVAGGDVRVGKPRDFPSFGWDNEYGHRVVSVPACRTSQFLISNGEFLEFVRAGGYLEPSYWSQLGWEWRCFRNTKWPAFWVPDGPSGSHRYKLRALFDELPMQWRWPAQVNFHEAQAFCKWKTAEQNDDSMTFHLTTEPIHQLMRNEADRSANVESDAVLTLPEDATMAQATGKNLNWSWLSFSAVDALPPSTSGFYDVFGNAWEWCEDSFSALPGFRVHPYYDDFSEPCFDGEHHVIMGGSFASAGDNGASKFSRYHFRPHFFQHAGFRVVEQRLDDQGAMTLATTDVNAPPPYVNGNPFRSSERVVVARGRASVSELSSVDAHAATELSCQAILQDVRGKSAHALAAFASTSTASTASGTASGEPVVVQSGTEGVAQLKHQVQRGQVLVVVPSDDATRTALGDSFELIASTDLPVVEQQSATEARVSAQPATAWQRLRD